VLPAAAGLFAILQFAVSPAIAAEYQAGPVADGGTIKGKIIYKGSVPTKTVLPTKDKETCGGPRKEPLVVVGPGGEVKDAVVHLKQVAKGKDWPKAAKKPEIDNVKCVFDPHVTGHPQPDIDIINNDRSSTTPAATTAPPPRSASRCRCGARPNATSARRSAGGATPRRMEAGSTSWITRTATQTGADGTFTISDVRRPATRWRWRSTRVTEIR
jgi:hypothetical protein